jgi:hypothetical protein
VNSLFDEPSKCLESVSESWGGVLKSMQTLNEAIIDVKES